MKACQATDLSANSVLKIGRSFKIRPRTRTQPFSVNVSALGRLLIHKHVERKWQPFCAVYIANSELEVRSIFRLQRQKCMARPEMFNFL